MAEAAPSAAAPRAAAAARHAPFRGLSPATEAGKHGSGTVVASPRSRDSRQSYGVATARRYPPHYGHGGGHYPWSDPWWWNSYPYSFGFFLWDPFWYGASYPVYGGYYGGGYCGGGGYDDPGYGYGSSGYGLYGSLKLKVKPRDAEVYTDGLFVGHVDDFDGLFQKLNLESGPRRHRDPGGGVRNALDRRANRVRRDGHVSRRPATSPVAGRLRRDRCTSAQCDGVLSARGTPSA